MRTQAFIVCFSCFLYSFIFSMYEVLRVSGISRSLLVQRPREEPLPKQLIFPVTIEIFMGRQTSQYCIPFIWSVPLFMWSTSLFIWSTLDFLYAQLDFLYAQLMPCGRRQAALKQRWLPTTKTFNRYPPRVPLAHKP